MYQLAGVVAQSVRSKALIHEVVGSNPAVTLSVLPKLGGWMTMLQRSKSRPTKVGLAPGEVPQSRLQLGSFHRTLSVFLVEKCSSSCSRLIESSPRGDPKGRVDYLILHVWRGLIRRVLFTVPDEVLLNFS